MFSTRFCGPKGIAINTHSLKVFKTDFFKMQIEELLSITILDVINVLRNTRLQGAGFTYIQRIAYTILEADKANFCWTGSLIKNKR